MGKKWLVCIELFHTLILAVADHEGIPINHGSKIAHKNCEKHTTHQATLIVVTNWYMFFVFVFFTFALFSCLFNFKSLCFESASTCIKIDKNKLQLGPVIFEIICVIFKNKCSSTSALEVGGGTHVYMLYSLNRDVPPPKWVRVEHCFFSFSQDNRRHGSAFLMRNPKTWLCFPNCSKFWVFAIQTVYNFQVFTMQTLDRCEKLSYISQNPEK